jgi:uncharacterized membrane protein YkoI
MSGSNTTLSRRAALARLGLAVGAVYCSPILTQLSSAQAASAPSTPSSPSAASPASAPSAASPASPPSSPSGPGNNSSTDRDRQDQSAGGCSAPSGSEGITISRRDMTRANDAVARGDAKPLREIFGIVQRRHPGQMIRVRFTVAGNNRAYLIRMVTETGSVQTVTVDALSGATLGIGAC